MGDQGVGYTVDEALSRVGFGKFQWLALVFSGLGWSSEAMEVMVLSFLGRAIQSEWRLSPTEESLLTTAVFAGMLVGAYFWGSISDIYGRKKAFVGAMVVIAGCGLLSSFSPGYLSLLVVRGFVGLGLGTGQVFAAWFLEFVPTSNRGAWMMLMASFRTLGSILEASAAWIILPRLGWRWLLALSSVPSFFVLLLSILAPESPRYLCTKGRTNEALTVLQKVALLNQKALPHGIPLPDHEVKLDDENVPLLDTHHLPSTSCSSLRTLFSSKYLGVTLPLWISFFGLTFSYYEVVQLTSQLSSLQNQCSSFTVYSKKVQDSRLYIKIFITNFAELPAFVLSAILMDKIGRKLTIGIMLFLSSLLLFPLMWNQTELVTTGLLFGSRVAVTATSAAAHIYCKEVYPTSVRSTGVGLATSMGKIGGMVSPLVAVAMVRNCHKAAAVIIFEVVLVLTGLCTFFFPFETKGRRLTDAVLS